MFTISSRKYLPFYFAWGSMVCQFTHMDKPRFYLAFQLACLDEWKDKPLGRLNTNESEDATTHVVSEMISFNVFPLQFPGVLLEIRSVTARFIFPDFEPQQGYSPLQEQMTTGDIPLIERVVALSVSPATWLFAFFRGAL